MSANYPVLPIAGGALARGLASLVAFVMQWLKAIARARKHRREASVLAGLDRNMLADIGITRSDLNDALSGSFWEDPTAVLRERAIERRLYRVRPMTLKPAVENGFSRPRTDRPARQTM
jgi:uncharacterized protein YjiS (DUF1127 family)